MPKLEELSSEDLINLIQTSTRPVAFLDDESKVDLNLSGIDIPVAVSFKNCTFKGTVDLSLVQTAATLDFSGSTFEKGLSLEGTRIGHHLILDGCTFKVESAQQPTLNTCRIDVKGDLLLRKDVRLHAHWDGQDMQIQGGIVAEGLTMQEEPRPTIQLNQARVGGGITIKRGRFGEIELQSSRIGLELNISQSHFSGEASFIGTHIGGQVDLQGVSFKKIYFDDVHVNNNLTFCAANKGIPSEVDGEARFPGAVIGGQAAFTGVEFKDVIFSGTEIKGGLFFQPLEKDYSQSIFSDIPCSIKGKADFVGTRIGGQARFEVSHFKELAFDTAEIKGTLLVLGDGKSPCHIEGKTSLRGAQIGGQVVFIGVTFKELAFDAAKVSADLMMQPDDNDNPCRITGEARFHSATIDGSLDFKGVIFGGRVALDRTVIKKTLFFQPDNKGRPCVITGDARFLGVHISGQAVFEGVRFYSGAFFNNAHIGDKAIFKGVIFKEVVSPLSELPLDLRLPKSLNNKIRYNPSKELLILEGGMSEEEKIQLMELSEDLSYRKAIEALSQNSTFSFSGIEIKGGITFKPDDKGEPCDIQHKVNFNSANIGGPVLFLGVNLNTITFDNTIVKGNLFFKPAGNCAQPNIRGEARFLGVYIGGQVGFESISFEKEVCFQGANVDGEVFVRGTAVPALTVSGAHIKKLLEIDPKSEVYDLVLKDSNIGSLSIHWEQINGKLELIGCNYNSVEDKEGLLRTLLAKKEKKRQPYQFLENLCRDIGEADFANEVYYQRCILVAPHWKESPISFLWDRLLRWGVGYGVKPKNILCLLGVFWLFGLIMFKIPWFIQSFDPPGSTPSLLDAAWLSIANLLPGVPGEYPLVIPNWELTVAGKWLATFQRIIGWLAISACGFAATGIFRRYGR